MKNKPVILVLTEWYRPGFRAGGPIQSCANLVDHLQNDFDFKILTTDTDYCEVIPYSNIESNRWIKMENGSQVFYLSLQNKNAGFISNFLKTETYDYLYLNSMFSPLFTILPLRKRKQEVKVVLAVRGMLAPGALAIKPVKKKLFLLMAKITGLFKDITFQATSVHEMGDIKKVMGSDAQIMLAGSLPAPIKKAVYKLRTKNRNSLRMVQVARIAPEKNLLQAIEMLKPLKDDIVFDVFGPEYDSNYASLCRKAAEALPSNIKVNFLGPVSHENLNEVLQNYHVLYLPTLGENFGHIIIEGMTAGLIPVISNRTPWRNLQQSGAGWDIDLSDIMGFEKALEKVSGFDSPEFEIMSKAAFNMALKVLDASETIKQNINLFTA